MELEKAGRALLLDLCLVGILAALMVAVGGGGPTAPLVSASAQEEEPKQQQQQQGRGQGQDPPTEEPYEKPTEKPSEVPVDAFANRPIIEGLWEFTAYSLRAGELRVGNLSLPFEPTQLRWLYLDVGLTETLQLGTAVPANALGVLNLIGKFRFLRSEGGFTLAFPFRLDLTYRPTRDFLLGTGLIVSWPLEGLTLHGGFWLTLSREKEVRLSAMYTILDATVLPDTKLLLEVDLYSGEARPLWIRLGTLRRVGVVHIRTAASLLFPGGDNLLQLDLFLRF